MSRTKIDQSLNSVKCIITAEVIQGSVLCPFLFTHYFTGCFLGMHRTGASIRLFYQLFIEQYFIIFIGIRVYLRHIHDAER